MFLVREDTFLNKKINFFSGELINFNTFIDYIAKIKNKNNQDTHTTIFC